MRRYTDYGGDFQGEVHTQTRGFKSTNFDSVVQYFGSSSVCFFESLEIRSRKKGVFTRRPGNI